MHDAGANRTMGPRARRIELPERGGSVAALDFGPAERPYDVIFSHANGFNARTYRTILAPLSGGLRILAYDLRGHGATQLPTEVEGRKGWTDLAQDLSALMERLELRDVVLAGHSMGATTSLLAAASAPQRVRSIVMFEPVLMSPDDHAEHHADRAGESHLASDTQRRRDVFPSREAAIQSYAGKGPFAHWTPAMLADYVEAGLVHRAEGGFELACRKAWEISNYQTAMGHDAWAAFAVAPRPIRLFRAEHGSTTRRDALAALPPDVHVRHVAGTTHFLPMERPDLVAQALREAASDAEAGNDPAA